MLLTVLTSLLFCPSESMDAEKMETSTHQVKFNFFTATAGDFFLFITDIMCVCFSFHLGGMVSVLSPVQLNWRESKEKILKTSFQRRETVCKYSVCVFICVCKCPH